MSDVSGRRLCLKAALVLASVSLATAGHAASLTITMLGNVTSTELPAEFPTDTPAKFTVTYDTGLAFTEGTPGLIAIYSSPASVWNVQVGTYVASALGGSLAVTNNFLGADRFSGSVVAAPGVTSSGIITSGAAVGGVPLFQMSFSVSDSTASLWSGDALPTGTFSGFDETLLMLAFFAPPGEFGSDLQVRANIYSFTIEPSAVQTPVPAALPLFATGLGVLGWAARRRKQKPLAA